VVDVLVDSGNWWVVRLNGRVGKAPRNYLKKIDAVSAAELIRRAEEEQQLELEQATAAEAAEAAAREKKAAELIADAKAAEVAAQWRRQQQLVEQEERERLDGIRAEAEAATKKVGGFNNVAPASLCPALGP
jgi:hypothetical protein